MAITLSGQNNVDKITASDGVIDVISGVNHTGVVTATTFKGDFEGNITGNVTGNINNTTLLFQIGGAEKVRIASNGRVGILTATPEARLDVYDTSGLGIISRSATTQATDTNKALKVRNNSTTETFNVSYKGQGYFAGRVGIGTITPESLPLTLAGSQAAIALVDTDRTNSNYYSAVWGDQVGNLHLVADYEGAAGSQFMSARIGGTALSNEKLRITSTGRLLIGTTTANQAGSYSSVVSTGASSNNGGFQAHYNTGAYGGGSMTTINAAGGGLSFWTYTGNVGAESYSERLRIDSSGRLLVGTDVAPSSTNTLLRVHTPISSSSVNSIEISHNTNGADKAGAALGLAIGNGGASTNAADLYFSTATNGSLVQRLRITSDGNVKIGDATTDYTYKLTVSGNGSVNTGIFMHDGAAGTWFGIQTQAANGLVVLRADARSGAYPPLTFNVGGSERLRIKNDGRICMGTTNVGSGSADDLNIENTSDHGGITIRTPNNKWGSIHFADGGTGNELYRGQLSYDHTNDYMRFYVGSSQ